MAASFSPPLSVSRSELWPVTPDVTVYVLWARNGPVLTPEIQLGVFSTYAKAVVALYAFWASRGESLHPLRVSIRSQTMDRLDAGGVLVFQKDS